MTTFSRRALRGALSVLVLIALAPATAQADSGGKLNFMKPAQSDFASYLDAPTSTQLGWMGDHYFRMRTYEPYFDSRLAWYPNAWSYEDAYAIYYGSEAGLESYILRDSAGNRLYIPFGCSGGTCPQYAADIGDPGWRARYINAAKGKVAKGYKGIFVDDVNFQMHVGNGNGTYVTPMDKRTGAPMTTDNWQRYFAEFMEELRAALPAEFEIVQNQVWFQGGGLSSAYVKRAIEASTHIEIERGVIDTGITGGGGQFGFETLLAWADYIHSRGKGVVWDAQSTWGREYQVATYYLVSNGLDSMGHPDGALPDSWWSGYDTDLGEPLGARYSWNGVLRRDFQNGFALVNQPGQTTKTLSLGGTFTRIGGSTASSVTLDARDGRVLLNPTAGAAPVPAPEPAPVPAPVPAPITAAPTAPVPVDGAVVQPAKLEVARSGVLRDSGVLDVLAPITKRASGTVDVDFHAAGRHTRFAAQIDSQEGYVRFRKDLPREQVRVGTGIITLAYPGNDRTRGQEVRLRAASGRAKLDLARPTLDKGRLAARGTISDRARGVVRVQLSWTTDGQDRSLELHAKIRDGRWSLDETLPASAVKDIARRDGTVHSYTLFTGYLPANMRGEMRSYEVLGAP